MSNNGLKNKNEIISKVVGNTEVLCNISKYHGNVSLKINLLSTIGVKTTDLFLYYDQYNSTNIGFGTGFTSNFFNKITYANNQFNMETFDGLEYEFVYIESNRYYNEELNQTILKQSGTAFRLFDGFGNVYDYSSNSNYPSFITYGESGYGLSLSVSNNRLLEVRVKSNARVVSTISFTYSLINGNYYATTITCTKPNNTYHISYSLEKISSITSNITSQSDLLTNMSYVYDTYSLTIKDNITSARCKVEYNHDSHYQASIIDKIEEDIFINNNSIDKVTTNITHSDDFVRVDDNNGNYYELYYDHLNEFFEYMVDSNYFLTKFLYNQYKRQIGCYNSVSILKEYIDSSNLISNGYFDSSSSYAPWSVVGTTNVGIGYDNVRPFASVLGPYYFRMKNTGNECYLEQTIVVNGTEMDSYTLVVWVKRLAAGITGANDLTFEVKYDNSNNVISLIPYVFVASIPHNQGVDSEWHPLIFDVTKCKSFNSINLKIKLQNTGIEYGIDGVLLIKNNVKIEASFYLKKKEKQENIDRTINYIYNYYDSYNDIDKLGMVIDSDGIITRYEYDQDCVNIIREESNNRTTERVYDNNEKNNLLKETISSNGKKLVREYTYTTSKDFIQSEKDYDNSITSLYTDETRGNVTGITYPNGNNMLTSYDNKDQVDIKEISGSSFLKDLNYTYESFGSSNEIIMSNNYKYDYDYSNNKINSVKINNLILEAYDYYNSYPYGIEKIKKGSSGDEVKFLYDSYGNLEKVLYKLKGENSYTLKYEYIYDNTAHNILKRVIVNCGNTCYYKDYAYDGIKNITGIYDSYNQNYDINYLLDDYSHSINCFNIDSKRRIEVLPYNGKVMKAKKQDLIDSSFYQLEEGKEKYYCFFNEQGSSRNYLKHIFNSNKSSNVTKTICPTSGSDITPVDDNGNYYLPLSTSAILKYDIPSDLFNISEQSLINGSVGFLFIPFSYNTLKTIFCIYDKNNYARLICESDANRNLYIRIYDSNNYRLTEYGLEEKYINGKTNYFGLSFSFNLSTNEKRFLVVFNNRTYDFSIITTHQLRFNAFSIGSYNGISTTASTFELYSLMFMPLYYNINVLNCSGLIKNYHLLKDIYEATNEVNDIIGMTTFTSSEVTDLTDFIPLSNSFISMNNKKPIHLNKRYDEECVRNKYFKYISSIRENMLKLDGINLVYDLCSDDSFTIGMKVIFNNIYNNNYIYNIKDDSKHIGLLIKDNYLYIDANATLINTSIYVTTSTLYFISFGLDYIVSSDSLISNHYKVRVVVNNGTPYEDTINSNPLSKKLLIIGSYGMNEEVDNYMDGYVNSLCYKNTYMSVSSINSLINELRALRTEEEYDGLSRPSKIRTLKGSLKLEKTLSYKQVEDTPSTNKDTLFIDSEVTKDQNNNTLLQRSYEYGSGSSYGNITKVRESGTLKNQYFYNEKGYITSSYYIDLGKFDEFTYDDNGNITRKLVRSTVDGTIYDDVLFYYDSSWPDRLIQVGSKKIDYDSDSIGCPKHFGYFSGNTFTSGITYSWRCSKLIGLTDSINNKTISYDYDNDGNRISKIVNGVTHSYYYEGNRLLLETFNNNRLDFLYNESNEIIGFDYTSNNVTNRYYYIKNILGDVIKIVDNTGAVVVTYLYSSYGEILSIGGTLASTIGVINPIRYRSYYYDNDTSMYYLKTRYYNPEWCRFISSDNIEYLETDNPLGVNLFSYCKNNPVMYSDPNGTCWWLALVIIVPSVVLIYAIGHTIYSQTGRERLKDNTVEITQSEDENTYTFVYDGKEYRAIYSEYEDKNNWHIENSREIRNHNDMKKICEALNDIHPIIGRDGTNRTSEDMMTEWAYHNFAFYIFIPFNIKIREQARHVDLDTDDQGKGLFDWVFGR